MILRVYKKEDSAIICKWLKTEKEVYCWSADRFNKFPLLENDIADSYVLQIKTKRFFPFTAVDEKEEIMGHFIRYPNAEDIATVHLGFVIINPKVGGKGYGKEMLCLGIKYIKDNFYAKRITLGVFIDNDTARYCYEAVGFKEYSRQIYEMPIGLWECIEMEMFIA